MTRLARSLAGLSAAMALAACQSVGGRSTASQAAATASGEASAAVAATATADTSGCAQPRSPGSGTPAGGTLLGSIDQGRIIFGLEGAGGTAGGTFAYAVISPSGLHVVATDDWTMNHETWAPGGQIMFDSERAGDRHLFRSDVNGTNAVEVTNDSRLLPGGGDAPYAEFSAAFIGSDQIVFGQWDCAEQRDLGLHVAPADGSGMVQLTEGHPVGSPISDDEPAVSPDGKTVVFLRYSANDDTAGGLFSIPTAGGTATRLTPDASLLEYPRFSPDGKTVLFTQPGSNGQLALWTVPAAGGAARELTRLPAGRGAVEADWSPDGSEIVTKEYEPSWTYNELHLIRADGTHDELLWRGELSTAELPHWAP